MSTKSREKRRLTPEASRLLYPFGRKLARLLRPLNRMSLKRMKALRTACQQITRGNCWWAIYRVAPVLVAELDSLVACEERRLCRLKKRGAQ